MYSVNIEEKKDVIIIHLTGELYFSNIEEVDKAWDGLVSKKPKIIAIDCAGLNDIDSTAVGYFVKLLNSTMKKHIKLVFYDLTGQIKKLFQMSKLDKFFHTTTKAKFEAENF